MMLTAVNGGLDRRSLLVDDGHRRSSLVDDLRRRRRSLLVDDGRRLTDLVDGRRRRSSFDVLSTVDGRR